MSRLPRRVDRYRRHDAVVLACINPGEYPVPGSVNKLRLKAHFARDGLSHLHVKPYGGFAVRVKILHRRIADFHAYHEHPRFNG